MSRSSRKRKAALNYGRPSYYPVDALPRYPSTPIIIRQLNNRNRLYDDYLPRTRVQTLDHSVSVFVPRTVRSPLMRTVRTDTTSRMRPPSMRRRPPVDLTRRAIDWTWWVSPVQVHWEYGFPNVHIDPVRPLTSAFICARRHIRKEVLFAKRLLNGKGSGGAPKSKVRC